MSEDAADQLFLGRQPILDREQRLVAYELLFRNGTRNAAEVTDDVQATATVIANAFSELGVEAALGTCRGFINVDEQFLFSDMLELLPRHCVVLEILETVPPSPAVVERCKALKAAGFTLALDDVIQLQPEFVELLTLVEIVKVDIQPLSRVQLMQLVIKLKPLGKQLLAEKVDSREQMELCLKLGFSLFQGYYFAKPTIIAGRKLDHSQVSLMKLMGLLLGDADTGELEEALKPEPGLTVNLLRMTNSVGSGTTETITSLRHAITVLGRRQLQRWLQLLVFASGKQPGTSNPLLLIAATRGRLMELLAEEMRAGDAPFADKAFMTGIMSLMPALIGLPISELIASLGLNPELREALCAGSGPLGDLLRLAESSEGGNLEQLAENLGRLPGLTPKALNRAQTSALHWANCIGQDK
ncbi:EAL and HDOD domain-containing protein [Dechloromonas denitrificans]|uniref:EAL and HDOD domain-containing protein n=1 Tax=Dechloromonas denitrificans TaxID=281362 RepID=UPI001CF8B1F7|nr:EAL domain-containing protein [Dechloromonas denitrificans]UCV04737.1 EAL domain-containing protein [Dechloromonas denitrificans]UCV09106.1 EAL domain-containing protein [Dechloromonas denitrificans]